MLLFGPAQHRGDGITNITIKMGEAILRMGGGGGLVDGIFDGSIIRDWELHVD